MSTTKLSKRNDDGFTLIEMLVAIVIVAILGGIVTAAVVQLSRSGEGTISHVTAEERLIDVMTGIARDVGDAQIVRFGDSSFTVVGLTDERCTEVNWSSAEGTLSRVQEILNLSPDHCSEVEYATAQVVSTTSSVVTATLVVGAFDGDDRPLPPGPGDPKVLRYTATVGTTSLTSSAMPLPS